jgi:Tol biopolymer transport system component
MKALLGCLVVLACVLGPARNVVAAPQNSPAATLSPEVTDVISGAKIGRLVTERLANILTPRMQRELRQYNAEYGKADLPYVGFYFPEFPPGVRISPDGTRLAYIDYIPGEEPADELSPASIAVFVDGKAPDQRFTYDGEGGKAGMELEIASLTFSSDSRHLAYSAFDSDDQEWGIFLDGHKADGEGSCGTNPEFSPDSERFAYVGCDGVVIDGRKEKVDGNVYGIFFSPDSKRVAYVDVRQQLTDVVAVVDGHEGKSYGDVRAGSFRFSPDSKKLAYVAANYSTGKQEAFVVVDGVEGKHYHDAGPYLAFSPDGHHLAYVAKPAENQVAFVVDGKEGKVYDALYIDRATFSPDSRRVAYDVTFWTPPPGATRDGILVVVNGQEGKRYNGKNISLGDLVFSPDSKHVAYRILIDAANNSGRGEGFVVSDGKEGKHYMMPGQIKFSPDSSHLAYAARAGSERFVVVDGQEGKHYGQIQNLVFSPDGKTLAYTAYDQTTQKWFVVVNGQEGKPYAQIEDLIFGPDGKYLAYAARNGQTRKWSVVLNGLEGRAYDGILINRTPDWRDALTPETLSLRFDAPNHLHYLAISGKRVLLVREKLEAANPHL